MSAYDMVLAPLHEAMWLYERNHHGASPRYLLVHPRKLTRMRAEFGDQLVVRDDQEPGKPPQILGLEVVEVDPRSHDEEFMEVVG